MGQAGIPVTSGFFAKFDVLSAVVGLGTTWAYVLGVIAMLSTVIATFFYLRIILVTWSAPLSADADDAASAAVTAVSGGGDTAVLTRAELKVAPSIALALTLCVAFTVAFGLAPGPIIHFATHATLIF
jgi:NADH-quinone oxidoreductase subunit N